FIGLRNHDRLHTWRRCILEAAVVALFSASFLRIPRSIPGLRQYSTWEALQVHRSTFPWSPNVPTNLLVLASIASSAFPADAPGHRNYTRGTDFHDLADALFILAKRSRICRTSEHFSRMSPQAWSDCRAEPAA